VQVAVTPSATPLLTREAMFKLKEAGLVRLGISLDGSTPEIHDAFRGLPGAWARTIQAIEWANEAGIPIQVHTTISRHNAHDLDNLCALFEKLAIVMWNVFLPGSRGPRPAGRSAERRGVREGLRQDLRAVAPGELPDQDHRGDALPPLPAAAQPGRAQRWGTRKRPSGEDGAALGYEPGAPTSDAQTRTASWATRRVNDGKGFMFISHVGNVYPSGFLPIHAGNIRETPLAEIYRNAPIFKSLRDTSKLEGKCGACEYKEICGGSRARAYALTGDPLAQEPCCIYQPKNWDPELEQKAEAFHIAKRYAVD
jgi:radical SAM protein with 4Fe4S-binding SPASM domain